jgi:superfamily I DNA and/or RNA helicase
MMADLPAGSIGWLLVDEAGQATPQAAVGAIMRSKRTIVVGDPLQIPPVVTLPEQLVSMIAKEFKVDPLEWTAPMASTQTVADQASNHQGEFRGDAEPRRVGIPLLVHRRCQDPMFGVSNEVAYDGQMVHAAGTPSPGSVTEAIGRSRWFDIDGEAETKWCPAEGDFVIRLLQELTHKGASEPDLFIISPFRDVANGIRNRLRSEAALFDAMGVGDLDEWLSDRVGTVHTVQGREAEAVFFVLGAPSAAHGGARAWAGNSPNIVNVAVSRAKQSLYVIGSHGAWSGVGHIRTLANGLPVAEKRSEVS